MTSLEKMLHEWNETNQKLNSKIKNILPTITAASTASAIDRKSVVFSGTGKALESLKVGGRTVQNGTPTPDVPVEVKGVGDKVVNLVDMMVALSEGNNTVKNSDSSFTTTETTALFNTPYKFSDKDITIKLSGSVKYTDGTNHRIDILDLNKRQVAELRFDGASSVVATGSYIRFNWSTAGRVTFNEVMITTDIDNDIFVPYGSPKYKIPVSCNGETTNICLDAPLFEGETVDLVSGKAEKKYGMVVLNGSENWITGTTQGFTYFGLLKTGTAIANAKNNTVVYSDYQVGISTANIAENIYVNSSGYLILLTQKLGTTVDAFKTWLSTHNMTVVYELNSAATETFDGAVIPTTASKQELTIDTEITPTIIDVTSFGDYYSKTEVDKMVNDLQPMFYSSLDTNKVRVTFDSFPTDMIYLINIRFTVDGNIFVCNLSSPRNSMNSQYFTTFTRYGGKNHTVTGYLNLALENREVVATLLNVELDGESIANPTITRLVLSCIK